MWGSTSTPSLYRSNGTRHFTGTCATVLCSPPWGKRAGRDTPGFRSIRVSTVAVVRDLTWPLRLFFKGELACISQQCCDHSRIDAQCKASILLGSARVSHRRTAGYLGAHQSGSVQRMPAQRGHRDRARTAYLAMCTFPAGTRFKHMSPLNACVCWAHSEPTASALERPAAHHLASCQHSYIYVPAL